MHVIFLYLFLLLAAGILYAVWQYQELKKFQVTFYETQSGKVKSEIKMAVIADLHSFSYGHGNERLIHAVEKINPDLILIPGDLIVTSHLHKYGISAAFIEQIVKIAPVIYSNGNHETKAQSLEFDGLEQYLAYRRHLAQLGALCLNNASQMFNIRGTKIRVSGLEVPLSCYEKGKKPHLEDAFMERQLGQAAQDAFQVLLAHNPEFAGQYAAWGADVTVCGHNHGGLIHIPGIGSIISSQLIWLPKYDAGEFTIGMRKIYVSRGLGTHTFHIRIFNRAELMAVTVRPAKKERVSYGVNSKIGDV